MSWNHKTDAATGMMKFSLTDDDGDIVASFRLNPTDIRLASRFQEVSEWFERLAQDAPKRDTLDDIQKYNDALEDKLDYVLGGNARASLFGVLSAVSIMPTGNLFAVEVFDQMAGSVIPEIKARRQKMQEAAAKYTAKYVPAISDDVITKAMEQAGVK